MLCCTSRLLFPWIDQALSHPGTLSRALCFGKGCPLTTTSSFKSQLDHHSAESLPPNTPSGVFPVAASSSWIFYRIYHTLELLLFILYLPSSPVAYKLHEGGDQSVVSRAVSPALVSKPSYPTGSIGMMITVIFVKQAHVLRAQMES